MSLNIHIQPDAAKAAQLLKDEREEVIREHRSKQAVREELPMGHLKMWVPVGYEKDRHLSYKERVMLDTMQGILSLKSIERDQKCWMHSLGCSSKPIAWVQEVGFDLKELGAALDFAQANSLDKEGPAPGFCAAHIASSPSMLAQAVYHNNILIQWGYLPSRWFVRFSDGTSARGSIKQINPTLAQPEILEDYFN